MKEFFRWQARLMLVLIVGVLCITGCEGCRRQSEQFPASGLVPVMSTVTTTDPVVGDTGVPINKRIVVTFSDDMEPATISTATVKLSGPDGFFVSGTVTYVGMSAVFRSANPLAPNTLYTAVVNTGVRNLGASGLAADYAWTFTTGEAADHTAPTVTSTDPERNATAVAVNKKIVVTFSEGMDVATIQLSTLTVTGPGGILVPGTVGYVGLTAQFTPAAHLANNTLYTVTVTTGATDLADNALRANYTWNFNTGAAADLTAPLVTSIDPAMNAVGVATNKKIAVTFSESMDPTTLKPTTFMVTGPGTNPVSGIVNYVGLTANFTPVSRLTNGTLYTVTINTGAKDLAGNALAARFLWSFTTGAAPDSTAPAVTSTDPANGATDVATNKKVAVTFSESMDPTTINNTTFTVTGPGAAPVPGTVSYVGLTANFTPSSSFTTDTLYTSTISTAAKDQAGNALAANKIWSFTTGSAADDTAPTVTSTDPANGATGVATNKKMTVTFSEGMEPTTINNTTFTVTGPGAAPVPGTVSCVGLTANFTPGAVLANGALYTVMMSTGAEDQAGNALTANYTWSFTTGAVADTTAPTVVSTSPVPGASGVAINKIVSVLFSEDVDPATINTTSFIVTKGGIPVPGSVTYVDMIAKFTSDSVFANNTLYTATITTGAKDLAGNALAVNKTWDFTTVAVVDSIAPTVVSTDPANNEVGVAINKKITATFAEAMAPGTINTLTFTVKRGVTPVTGSVSYTGLIAKFTPDSDFLGNTVYTVTITTEAKDQAGNALAAAKTWPFTTGAVPDVTAPLVNSTDPVNGALDVPINDTISASFNEGMDPDTITNVTFVVAGVAGTVTYDAGTKVATWKPTADLAVNTTYSATISAGAKDLAGNPLAAAKTWTFRTGLRRLAGPVALGTIAPFGSFGGGAGITNQGTFTQVNGDIGTTGVSGSITGFHDSGGTVYTETLANIGFVSGLIYTGSTPPGPTPGLVAGNGALDARTAFNNLSPAALPGGVDVSAYGGSAGQLANRTLAPGIYRAALATYAIQGGNLTLDAQGDANAVWVFQMAESLTVGGPGAAAPQSVLLINGAQAKNVYWQVGSAATINAGGGGTMVGTIIAEAGVTFSTAGNVAITRLDGRALGLNASVTMVNTVVTVPAP